MSLACIGTLPSPTYIDPGMARRAHLLMALPDRILESLYARHSRRSFAQGSASALIDRLLDRPIRLGAPGTCAKAGYTMAMCPPAP